MRGPSERRVSMAVEYDEEREDHDDVVTLSVRDGDTPVTNATAKTYAEAHRLLRVAMLRFVADSLEQGEIP